jgi:hypothetical protein
MKKGFLITLVCLGSLVSGCAMMTPKYASDIEVASESDPKVNLAAFKDYAWERAGVLLVDKEGQWEPPSFDMDSEAKFLIDSQLRGKGLTENSANPDLLLVITFGVNMDALKSVKVEKEEYEIIQNVPAGALVLILVDASTQKPVWIGAARAEVQKDLDEATVKARLKYAVDGMFRDYPAI